MKRLLYSKLVAWKKRSGRKPLVMEGARQVGKTHLLKEFGKQEFKQVHYFNFEENQKIGRIFEPDLEPKRILGELETATGKSIRSTEDLVIFDEIQQCPLALTSLKYFQEEMPDLALCTAGSLLGLSLSSSPFPVGKVEFLHLYPMNFEEFLMALEDQRLYEAWKNANFEKKIASIVHDRLWQILKEYYFTGGMPEVVGTYLTHRESRHGMIEAVRKIQKDLITSYHRDFAKHSGPVNAFHIVSVFENVPMQLARSQEGSVARFYFQEPIPGKKSHAQLQGPIDWLEKAGLIIKVKLCNRAELPLESFCKGHLFKLFLIDVGLLGFMLDLSYESVFNHDYGIAKGYFAENYVAQELRASGLENLYSWTERNSEIEFILSKDGKIIPVEVKSGFRTQAKSLAQFFLKYHPDHAILLSANNLQISEKVHHYPLYLAGKIGA